MERVKPKVRLRVGFDMVGPLEVRVLLLALYLVVGLLSSYAGVALARML